MGGRLDAVNLVDADVAVVVSVGLDHVEWLGSDVESIGREKAGIFRTGRPAIVGMRAPPRSLVDAAAQIGAPLRLIGRDFDGASAGEDTWDYRDGEGRLDGLPLPALAGAVQVGNAAVALAALRSLGDRLSLDRAGIERGLWDVRLPGRFQRVASSSGFEWVLDVAHNPDSARVLAVNLERFPVTGRTIAVCGMLADKDVGAVLGLLDPTVDEWIAAGTEGPRSLDAASLVARASSVGVTMQPGGPVVAAMQTAAARARDGDRVVVFGSFHTVGPALEQLARGA
jgi:dihydrofolate synthase/folylpolyglutamate synthase